MSAGVIPRLLIVEDEAIVAYDLQVHLEGLGCEITAIAMSGEEALLAVAKFQPDLVIMDIGLHGAINGIDAARSISEKFKIPLVFMTANSDPATVESARKANPIGFIFKPFDVAELKKVVRMASEKRIKP